MPKIRSKKNVTEIIVQVNHLAFLTSVSTNFLFQCSVREIHGYMRRITSISTIYLNMDIIGNIHGYMRRITSFSTIHLNMDIIGNIDGYICAELHLYPTFI